MKNIKTKYSHLSSLASAFSLIVLITVLFAVHPIVALANPTDLRMGSRVAHNDVWSRVGERSKEILVSSGLLTTGYEVTIIDPETASEIEFWLQTTQDNNGIILYTTILPDGTTLFFNIHQSFSTNAQGYHDTNQIVVALNASLKEYIIRCRVSVYEFGGIAQPLIGGFVSVDSYQIKSNGNNPVLGLHTDGAFIESTAVVVSPDLDCSQNEGPCILQIYGDGAALPVPSITESYGATFEFMMPAFDTKLLNAQLTVAKTTR